MCSWRAPGWAALPSVTRGSTVLRTARPLTRDTDVLILDVLGRRTRTLSAAAGTRTVTWNGRTDAGAPAAPGVYFIKADSDPRGTARVTLIR